MAIKPAAALPPELLPEFIDKENVDPQPQPSDYILRTPDRAHFPRYFDQTPNYALRKTLKSLSGKAKHSMVIGSAKKDMQRIRVKKVEPDEEGNVFIESKSTGKVRQYTLHRFNPMKRESLENRLIPVAGPNILPVSGKVVLEIYNSFLNSESQSFEQFLAEKIAPS